MDLERHSGYFYCVPFGRVGSFALVKKKEVDKGKYKQLVPK